MSPDGGFLFLIGKNVKNFFTVFQLEQNAYEVQSLVQWSLNYSTGYPTQDKYINPI